MSSRRGPHDSVVLCPSLQAYPADLPVLIFGKAMPSNAVRLPWLSVIAPLRYCVQNVVTVRSKEQVVWIDALSVVAMVTDEQTFWDWPVMEFPRDAMREGWPSERGATNVAVAIRADVCRPLPTRIVIGSLHFRPESFSERNNFVRHQQLLLKTTRGLRLPLSPSRLRPERGFQPQVDPSREPMPRAAPFRQARPQVISDPYLFPPESRALPSQMLTAYR